MITYTGGLSVGDHLILINEAVYKINVCGIKLYINAIYRHNMDRQVCVIKLCRTEHEQTDRQTDSQKSIS